MEEKNEIILEKEEKDEKKSLKVILLIFKIE